MIQLYQCAIMEASFQNVFKNIHHIESYVGKEGMGQDSAGADSCQFPAKRFFLGRGTFLRESAGIEFWFLERTLGIAGQSKPVPAQKKWNSGSRKSIPGRGVQNCRNEKKECTT
jgi:hypothetical protein